MARNKKGLPHESFQQIEKLKEEIQRLRRELELSNSRENELRKEIEMLKQKLAKPAPIEHVAAPQWQYPTTLTVEKLIFER